MKYCLQKQNRTIRERLILVLVLIYLMQRLPKTRGNPQGPLNQDPQLMSSPDINLRNSSHLIQTPLLIYSINVTDQTPAPDGSFTKAMGKLRNLREEVTKNAGADMHTWDWFNSLFGSWGQWLTKMGIIIGIVVVMFLLLFCCIVPFIRSMLASAAAKQMINVSVRPTGIDVGCTNTYTVGPGLDELDEFV